ncbi:MAG: hypothetical protein L0K41_05770 [Yaniella sp.]|uniref:hypothetical protein n=1 Tax=Yaniella sp. TaxID=2773929 RepID=UPI0017F007FF|nr:hypothetical protein [Yaniella sp.]NLZ99383.1 hypothetical protein [Micrococcus sp.]HIY86454.1 hypothetical protein [Candidatus Yaniella excrementavium]MDN5705285.1 hypothetical protein [Yaniella sp.]MDN5732032.1 hypothetical protein [Yaniella sp.]MDN5742303.1 hypothetical protein [Yaniella sp.]
MTQNRPEREFEYFMNSNYELYAYMQENLRKERRDAILMIILGMVFAASGVFILFIGSGWMALTSITFGAAIVLGGILKRSQSDGSEGSIIIGIILCLLFTAFSLFMLLSGVLAPEAWGHRSPLAPIIGGGLGLLFFGPGSILLIIREVRRRTRSNARQQPKSYPHG